MRKCENCKKKVVPIKKFSVGWFIVLLILGVLPGILYILYYSLIKKPRCPMCNTEME